MVSCRYINCFVGRVMGICYTNQVDKALILAIYYYSVDNNKLAVRRCKYDVGGIAWKSFVGIF